MPDQRRKTQHCNSYVHVDACQFNFPFKSLKIKKNSVCEPVQVNWNPVQDVMGGLVDTSVEFDCFSSPGPAAD